MTNEKITTRCQHCGGTRKEHGTRKPYRCPTKLAESYWAPWTVEAYEAAVERGKRTAQLDTDLSWLPEGGKGIDAGLERMERRKRTVTATGRYCVICGADEGLPHHDEQHKLIVTALEEHGGKLHCQPCLEGSLQLEHPAEFLLAKAARLQTEFWEALRELEEEVGCELDANDNLEAYDMEDLREMAREQEKDN